MKEVSLKRATTPEKPGGVKSEIDEEIAFHLSMACEEAQNNGMGHDDAEQWAAHKFGDIQKIRLVCLGLAWKERLMEKLFSPAAVIIMFFLCCVVMGVLFFTAQARHRMAMEARDMALVAEQNAMMAKESEERARAATQMLVDVFEGVDQPAEQQNEVTVSEILKRASTKLEIEFKDQPEILNKLKSIISKAQSEIDEAPKKVVDPIDS